MKRHHGVALLVAVSCVGMMACGNQAVSAGAGEASGRAAAPTGFGAMKTVELVDPMFNMVAVTMSIPANWNLEGTVLHGPGCNGDYAGTAFRAYSADMLYGIQMIPASYFYWADDERAIPQGANCKALQPMSAAAYGQFVSIRMRPDSEVDSFETASTEATYQQAVEKNNQMLASAAAAMGNPNPPTYSGEVKRVHIHYSFNGHPEEEWLNVAMSHGDQPVSINTAPMGQMLKLAMRHEFISTATVTGYRAPQGQMQAHDAAFQEMLKTLKPNPDYQAKFAAYIQDKTARQIRESWQSFHSIMQQSDQQFRQMRANAQQAIRDMQAQGDARRAEFNAAMDRKSGHARDVSDYLLDQQYYVNPTTGQTTTASNQYNHTYSNGSGTVAQTNSPTGDPNGLLPGNWVELQPIKH